VFVRLTLSMTLALAACDQGNGLVSGATLDVPDCKKVGEITHFEPFRMTLNLLNVAEHQNAASLRFGSKAGRIHTIDQIGVDLFDVATLKQGLKAGDVTLTLHPGLYGGEPVNYTDGALMAFGLFGKCPNPTAALGALGTLTFHRYSAVDAARVEGTFLVDIIDRRSGEVLGRDIAGDFDFEVETATPATPYQPEVIH